MKNGVFILWVEEEPSLETSRWGMDKFLCVHSSFSHVHGNLPWTNRIQKSPRTQRHSCSTLKCFGKRLITVWFPEGARCCYGRAVWDREHCWACQYIPTVTGGSYVMGNQFYKKLGRHSEHPNIQTVFGTPVKSAPAQIVSCFPLSHEVTLLSQIQSQWTTVQRIFDQILSASVCLCN